MQRSTTTSFLMGLASTDSALAPVVACASIGTAALPVAVRGGRSTLVLAHQATSRFPQTACSTRVRASYSRGPVGAGTRVPSNQLFPKNLLPSD